MRSNADKLLALAIARTVRVVIAELLQAPLLLVVRISKVAPWADTLSLVRDTPAACILATGVGDLADVDAGLARHPAVALPWSRPADLRLSAVPVFGALVFSHADSSATLRQLGRSWTVGVGGASRHALAAGANLAVKTLTDAGTTS